MSKNAKLFLGIAAIGAVIFYLSRAAAGRRLNVSFFGLKLGRFTGFSLPVEAKFRILNGSNTPIRINSIVGQLYVSGKQLSTVSQITPFDVPANSDTIYTVLVQTSALDVINIIRDLLRQKQKLAVTFEGNINSTGINIPIKQTVITI